MAQLLSSLFGDSTPKGSSFTDKPIENAGEGLMAEIGRRCPGVFLVCFRNKNKNVVVYEAMPDQSVSGYWLILDPSHREQRRKSGIQHDREEFGLLDNQFAWFFRSRAVDPSTIDFRFGPRPEKVITVKVGKEGGAKAFYKCPNTKRLLWLRSMYVQASEDIHVLDPKKNVSSLYFNVIDMNTKQPDRYYVVGGPN